VALLFEDRSEVRKVLFPDYLGKETSVQMLRRDYPGDNDYIRSMAIYSVEEKNLWMVDLEDRTNRRIGSYSWSQDGNKLMIDQSSENTEDRWIYAVEPEGEKIREIWHDRMEGRIAPLGWISAWQTDSQGILFVSDLDGYYHLYALGLNEQTPNQLTRGNWSIIGLRGHAPADITVSPKTGEVFFTSTKKNPYERQVYKIPEKGGSITEVTSLPGCHAFYLSSDATRIALLHSDDVTPPELYIVSTRERSGERRITHSPPEDFNTHRWIQPRYVTFKSHIDGTLLHGRLLIPSNLDTTKKYPVIIGPVYSDTVRNQWSRGIIGTFQQYLALEGQYIGFHIDIRGSSGYGVSFRDQFKFEVGDLDIDDLHSGVKYLKTLPYVDPERIAIWGISYGGLLTTMSLFKKPGVYKAGVAGAPATNVWHAMTSEVRLLGRPDTHPEVFKRSSSFSHAENLQDPLMIIHGMYDSAVLFKDSVQLVEKLMLSEKNFDFVVAPSAWHHFWVKDYVAKYILKKMTSFFDLHVGRGPE